MPPSDDRSDQAQGVTVRYSPDDRIAPFAARGLAARLSAMFDEPVAALAAPALEGHRLVVDFNRSQTADSRPAPDKLKGDSFRIVRDEGAITIESGSEPALLHAVGDLFEQLGASFAPWRDPEFPTHTDKGRLRQIASRTIVPAFERRAVASDLKTWHYEHSLRLEEHLAHDRRFIPWMAARGLNAFMFIRHTDDTRVRVDALNPILERFQVGAEYGGHVAQLLMPRELFGSHPEYFAVGPDGARTRRGNFCVSNREALALVRDNAIAYVRDYPENRMLHVWGADLKDGGWCRCAACAAISPQRQYLKMVDTIAAALADSGSEIPIVYLAYHDTLEPDPALRPRANVWFEWAPRERCYGHPIDDPACAINRKYLRWLERYLEIFDGRGMVFEYYADAILFGGLGFATPAVIVRDLQAYHRLGIRAVSCLTFGAFSVFAYPLNLETFARATRSLGYDPEMAAIEVASTRYPRCASAITDAYRAIARGSALALRYGEVLRPFNSKAEAALPAMREAYRCFAEAVTAAEHLMAGEGGPMLAAEHELWRLSREVLTGLGDYVAARSESGVAHAAGAAAIERIAAALSRMDAIAPEFKGTWGTYDFDRFKTLRLTALRRRQQP
ncbi:MAG TPA: DUF4838 domain-containing protein [Candidatus Binataceae bacterium]|nr:DUF4838 domain-containing protein [Candidatus Binataceae bacterium]